MDNLSKIKQLLRQADYQGLIRIGAPKDEYDHEALIIYQSVSKSDSINDIAQKIWNVFYVQFCTGEDGSGKFWEESFETSLKMIGGFTKYKDIAASIKAHLLGIF